ncbi:hypothetical protein [Kribbella sp. VKM Ac-2568]|uniref:hypothetical protein n=1 Tax=Kribbella sp. VKM Ac-2568 TaxID=2512219 RepID=UPI00104A4C4F|nr:hypothetical protein [Kribbella sp. VKM Ac-2568]TCM51644.1 hypothetical protein EV648_101481 [Kribbella sp. VKM Ac-2568]
MTARYNGLADWYDARFVVGAPRHMPSLPELLGPGSGPCLDLGCGTGRNFDTIRQVGMRHIPLPELLNAFLRPELTVEHIEEPGDMPVPHALAIKARRN